MFYLKNEESPRNHDVCYGMGTLCAMAGKNAASIPWFEKAISIFPCMAEVHYNPGIECQRTKVPDFNPSTILPNSWKRNADPAPDHRDSIWERETKPYRAESG